MSHAALAGGIALAAVAGCCFDGAIALQALEARALEVRRPGAGMIRGLLARPRWLAATVLSLAGWPFQVAALALAPLTVVQPALAVGLILLLFLGNRLLHERVRPRDYSAVAAISVGLALLAWKAPEAEHVHAGAKTLTIVLGILVGAAVIPWILRAPGARDGRGRRARLRGVRAHEQAARRQLRRPPDPAVLGRDQRRDRDARPGQRDGARCRRSAPRGWPRARSRCRPLCR